MPPTTRNKTPLKKHVLTKRQNDVDTNQYAVLSYPDPKGSIATDTSARNHPMSTKDDANPPTSTFDDTNERIDVCEQEQQSN